MAILNRKIVLVNDRYTAFLNVVLAFHEIHLPAMEKQIIVEFFWASNGIINTASRQKVRESMGITSQNLNNQILKLRKKDLIVVNPDNDQEDTVIKDLIPDIEADKQSLIIQLELSTK